jgi:capsular exopolysaccharide synthesis family protein
MAIDEARQEVRSAKGESSFLQKALTPEGRRAFAGIYENLLATSSHGQPKSVLVCSATTGEGATSIATGLALAAAEKRKGPVLLIDGNFHNPQICRIFQVAGDTGLGNLLNGNSEVKGAARQTAIPNLSVMGAGAAPADHVQALEPMKFHRLLETLGLTYSFIVVDGPSINAFPESLLYAPQVDRVLLVVSAGKTRVPVASKALAKLAEVGCANAEVILNRRTFVIPQVIYEKL